MSRPSDWHVLGLDADPTPGDPFRVRELARKLLELAADAQYAGGQVRRLSSGAGALSWVGEAGAVFAAEVGELPGQLGTLETSYEVAGRALTAYGDELESAQVQADGALSRGREAYARLLSAREQVGSARAADEAARSSLGVSTGTGTPTLAAVPAPWQGAPPPGPDPAEVTRAIRAQTTASEHLAYVQGLVAVAESDLDAERRLALAARGLREDAARTCTREIHRASDAGIQNDSWWTKAGNILADAWNVIVDVAKIVVLVLGVVVLIIGGPLAWVVFAAGLVLLVDALIEYGRGEGSLWDIGLALLGCIPGTRGLTTLGGLAKGFRGLRASPAAFARGFLADGRALLGRMATNVRSIGAGAKTFFDGLPDLFIVRPAFAMAGGPADDAGRTFGDLWSEASDAASAARREGGTGGGSGTSGSADEAAVRPPDRDALGGLVPVNKLDPAADALAERLGGSSRVRFADDPTGREFDAVSDDFVAQSKPADFQINKSFRDQAKATFEVALATGRRPYFHFDGPPRPGVVEKLQEYEQRYNVRAVFDFTPLGSR